MRRALDAYWMAEHSHPLNYLWPPLRETVTHLASVLPLSKSLEGVGGREQRWHLLPLLGAQGSPLTALYLQQRRTSSTGQSSLPGKVKLIQENSWVMVA